MKIKRFEDQGETSSKVRKKKKWTFAGIACKKMGEKEYRQIKSINKSMFLAIAIYKSDD